MQFASWPSEDGLLHSIFDASSPVNREYLEQTETRQFKKWFGKSKVVNADGTPKKVYHGTDATFTFFDKSRIGSETGDGLFGNGFYFSDSEYGAGAWSESGATMTAYLSMQKPYRATLKEVGQIDAEKLAQEGYDGIIADYVGETYYVVFEPTQIKSATENIGTFDSGNPDIRFSARELQEPEALKQIEEAARLFANGVHYLQYDNQPDVDWRVGKYLRGMWEKSQQINTLQAAQKLYADGTTPWEYAQKAGRDYDHKICTTLRNMYIVNNQSMGGALAKDKLDKIMSTSKSWKRVGGLKKFLESPVRMFENLGNWRDGSLPSDLAKNYVEGSRLRDVYWSYGLKQGAEMDLWMQEEQKRVAEAFGKADVFTSALAQMIGEKWITEESAKKAVTDGKTLIVPIADGVMVFDRHGQLMLMADGFQTAVFDKTYRERMRKANTDRKSILLDAKLSEDEKQEKIRQVQIRAGRIAPTPIEGSLRVEVNGNSVRVVSALNGVEMVSVKNGHAPDIARAVAVSDTLADFYRRAFLRLNQTLVENGYAPINEMPDYFPHQGRVEDGVRQFIDMLRGQAELLPTEISGMTGVFTPGKPWFQNALERMGTYTEFDAIRGFNKYVQGAGNVIFYTPVIQRLRQLERALRIESEGTTNSEFVSWLRNYANQIANKKADIDRAFEDSGGRSVYTLSDWMTRAFGAAAVAGNISSALSNLISFMSAIPTLNKKHIPSAIVQTVINNFKKTNDGLADQIPFLVRRFDGYEGILTSGGERFKRFGNKVMGCLFAAVDRFSTEAVCRAKYAELRSKGMEADASAQETSVYANKIFADRSKGMTPALFGSKIFKPLAQFQLEAVNQLSHIRDINRQGVGERLEKLLAENGGDIDKIDFSDAGNRIKKKGVKELIRLIEYLICMSLYGLFSRKVIGRDQTLNPYGLVKDFASEYKESGFWDALLGSAENVAEQMPFISSVLGGGRMPAIGNVEKAIEEVIEIFETLGDGNAPGEQKAKAAGESAFTIASYFAPGGGQLRKTVTGIEAIIKGGSYTDKGNLRYPISDDDFWRVLLFGPSAVAPEGYDWQNDPLNKSQTEQYQQYVDGGASRKDAYAAAKNRVPIEAMEQQEDGIPLPYFGPDRLGEKQVLAYYDLAEKGLDPETVYYALLGYDDKTNASKGLSMLTADSDKDGKPDFSEQELELIAAVMGWSYDAKEDGTVRDWAEDSMDTYLARKRKDVEKGVITQAEYDEIAAEYDDFWETLLGMK